MSRFLFSIFLFLFFSLTSSSQEKIGNTYDEGLSFTSKKDKYQIKIFGFAQGRFGVENNIDSIASTIPYMNFTVPNLRIGASGFLLDEKFKFMLSMGKLETDKVDFAPGHFSPIHDAYLSYKVIKGLNLKLGQFILAGSKENMLTLDRIKMITRNNAILNYGLNRDIGFEISHSWMLGPVMITEIASASNGEGRLGVDANLGGLCYTFRGEFALNDEVEEDRSKRLLNKKPIYAIGATYSYNDNASRSYSLWGESIGVERDVKTLIIDGSIQSKQVKVIAEYYERVAPIPVVYDTSFNIMGIFQSGRAYSVSGFYKFQNDIEIGARYSLIAPLGVTRMPERQFITLAFNKYLYHDKFKIQSNLIYDQNLTAKTNLLKLGLQVQYSF